MFIQIASAKLAKRNPLFSRKLVAGANHTFGVDHPFKGTTPALEEALGQTLEFVDGVLTHEARE